MMTMIVMMIMMIIEVELGNRVEVRINSVELERKRIGLDLLKVI